MVGILQILSTNHETVAEFLTQKILDVKREKNLWEQSKKNLFKSEYKRKRTISCS